MIKIIKLLILLTSFIMIKFSYSQNLQIKKKDLHIFLEGFIYELNKDSEKNKFSSNISCLTNEKKTNVCNLTITVFNGYIDVIANVIIVYGIYSRNQTKMLIHSNQIDKDSHIHEYYFSCKLPLTPNSYKESCKEFLDEEDAVNEINKDL